MRKAEVARKTKETDIVLSLAFDEPKPIVQVDIVIDVRVAVERQVNICDKPCLLLAEGLGHNAVLVVVCTEHPVYIFARCV